MHRMLRVVLLVLLVLTGVVSVAAQDATPSTGATPAAATPAATPVATSDLASWLEVGPGGVLIARAVIDGACPTITIDDIAYDMDVRAASSEQHPNTVCETTVPAGSSSVLVGDTNLRLPVPDPKRILLIGDTGCRMKAEDNDYQACNDPAAWPFAALAEQGASWQPDLIIHVGDYHYRESPCPEGNAGCAGSPWGYNWASWEADFFAPAKPLLEAAPWVFLRGNHEDCSRAGYGWFRYLDPRPMPTSCLDFTEPYAVPVGDVQAVVLDAAAAGDTSSNPATNAAYREQFAKVESLAGDGPAWLLTHRPFWSIADGSDPGTHIEWTTASYTGSGYTQPPPAIDIVIAGHVHMGQVLTFTEESGRPLELIAGNSGTSLEMETGVFTGSDIRDDTMVKGWRYAEFGSIGLERTDSGWVATVLLLDATAPLTCVTTDEAVACVP